MNRFLLLVLLQCGLAHSSQAQGEFWTWCIGGFSGLAYYGQPKVTFTPQPNAPDTCVFRLDITNKLLSINAAGTSSLSDARGQLLGYSQGVGLTDRRGQAMPNGLLNAPGTLQEWFFIDAGPYYQPVAMAPAPVTPHDYYTFYWTRTAADGGRKSYALTYARIDGRLNGGFGDVVMKGRVLGRTVNPRLTVVRHTNNRDYWVLTRHTDGRGFQAFLLNRQGVQAIPVVSLAGQSLEGTFTDLKAAPNGRRLACGVVTGNAALFYGTAIYDFDNATGAVTNELVVHRSVDITQSVSFSPNSQLLYTTEYPTRPFPPRRQSELWQSNLTFATEAAIVASRYQVSQIVTAPTIANDFLEWGGLQLAPNGTVWSSRYITRYPPLDPATGIVRRQAAAVIRHPDVPGAGCSFESEGYAFLPDTYPGIALPNIITNMLYAPAALNYEATCPDDSVQFWASSAGDPAGLRWDFGEPASGAADAATGAFVAHRYQRGGTYTVRLTLADGRVLTQAVTVSGAAADFTQANVFTPNGDGLNDDFVPVRVPLPGGRLRVFSRWGTLVFQTTDPALRWDGMGAAAGDYFYELEYPDCRGATQQLRGTVLLVR